MLACTAPRWTRSSANTGCASYLNAPEAERQALLDARSPTRARCSHWNPPFETTNMIIATWRMMAEAHRRYGSRVIDT